MNKKKRIGTGYYTTDPKLVLPWIEILSQKDILFWMTARIGDDGIKRYFFQTVASEEQSLELEEKYRFEHPYPIGEGESLEGVL